MRLRFASVALSIASLAAVAQTPGDNGARDRLSKAKELIENSRRGGFPQFSFAAGDATVLSQDVIRLKGKVIFMFSGGVKLSADQAEYHLNTGEINPRGHVHLIAGQAVDPRAWSQFGIK
jgi:lipopolysaccharide assembly outer membrane protein LptD (OstA)